MSHSLTLELRDFIYDSLMARQEMHPDLARDRANNLAMALVGNYDIRPLASETTPIGRHVTEPDYNDPLIR